MRCDFYLCVFYKSGYPGCWPLYIGYWSAKKMADCKSRKGYNKMKNYIKKMGKYSTVDNLKNFIKEQKKGLQS